MRYAGDIQYITPNEYGGGLWRNIGVQPRKPGNPKTPRKTKKRQYADAIVTFDIETTRLTGEQHPAFAERDQAIMYSWCLHVHGYLTIHGRTWEQLGEVLAKWAAELAESVRIVVYIHNLSFEFQFLRALYDFQADDVFAVERRRVLKTDFLDCFELRCSYLHSNMSLAEYADKMQAAHGKLSGVEYDYKKIRYPWTPMSDREIEYQLTDCVALAECLKIEMELDGDNLYTVPATSTGYVRREVKKALAWSARVWIRDTLPDEEIFEMLHEAFRGGDTHANRYFVGRIIDNVKSADRSSSYPDVQCNHLFPMGSWTRLDEYHTFPEIMRLINVRKKAMVLRIAFPNGCALADIYDGFPYLSYSKCRNVQKPSIDNGRILSADYLETTVTDVDLRIIVEQYTGDISILDGAFTRYGNLPEEYKTVIRRYYDNKTRLKDVEGEEVFYTKEKNKLNGIYGCSAQNPAKQSISFVSGGEGGDWVEGNETTAELLDESYKHAFQSFAWGVWTTAWARWELREGLKVVGRDNAIYCDTDSWKYIGEADWTAYNARCIAASTESKAFATDPKGKVHYMGVFEQERSYNQFATLGAKKYAYNFEPGGKTHVTIAGVTKRSGGAELDKGDEYGHGLERFCRLDPPFTFYEAGGLESLYNDHPTIGTIHIDGHDLTITPNVVIRESTYTLTQTAEYEFLLKSLWTIDNYTIG